MIDFEFYSPTKYIFGKDKHLEIGNILKSYNFKKILVIIGMGSVKNNGVLRAILQKLDENQIEYKVFEGVRANPTIELCHECIKVAHELEPDMILALGGGSVIDTAKNVAVGYFYDGDSFDFNLHKVAPTKALPIGVILTISAAGSESSSSCVISNDLTGIKMGFNSDLVRPVFAIENPELTYSVNKVQTAYGIVDIMMHTLERYFTVSNEIEPADGFSLSLLKTVVDVAKTAYDNPNDYDSRAVLMLMSSLSHNDLTNIGKKKSMPVHALEHCVSGVYPNVAHGAGLAVLFPAWAKYYVKFDVDKFDILAKNVFGKQLADKHLNALAGIEELEKLFDYLEMPKTFKDLGIIEPDIDRLVNILTNNGTRVVGHHIRPMDKDVAREIFVSCVGR